MTTVDTPTAIAPPGRQRRSARARRRSAVWIILGVLLLLYPLVATLWNNYQLGLQAQLYQDSVSQIDPPDERARIIEQAREYNARLAAQGHHALPPRPESPGFDDYMATLATERTGGAMARIKIESIDVDLPVYHTTKNDVLYQGAGHMFGSSLPVGGQGNNAVITAHTGMVNASMFDHLPMLKDGAIIKVEVMGEVLHYQVYNRKVVRPDLWQAVSYEPGIDKLTLITCTPYGINTDRLLVEARRVAPETPDAGSWWPLRLSWWMLLDLAVIAVAIIIVSIIELRRRKRRAAAAQSQT